MEAPQTAAARSDRAPAPVPAVPAADLDVPSIPRPEATDGDGVVARVTVDSPERMTAFGRELAALLGPGDLVLLTGELGAGKTTLTRGLGEGLGVRGAVTSPTFVIARVHPSLVGGPALVHVDAYRLAGGLDEMEDLDLDVSLPDSVIVVEWGDGKVEELSEDRLHVLIERAVGAEEVLDDVRRITVRGLGGRWSRAQARAGLEALAAG
ncbi:tRNA (adenosine(37)-N6)-threonylcarbamoyltransferase complex ATPase subunit type 1 TsaE [Streptomyces sp. BI20]|uniref:tRNA (adenosine(37)-N6)-threonylcarbamoyltransferase complex ATPase subunit type 1 TsaE n=1 Tax=Streptomyces sp. BI20 TaxID=3403460 RepID=UPI003C787166